MHIRDKTALSYWFPKLQAAGLPVPKTIIISMPKDAQKAVWAWFDGEKNGDMKPFITEIEKAGADVGWPAFLRTDHTSGKHNWKETCFLPDEASIGSHVMAIAEFSEIAGMMGELPWNTWVVREMLPTRSIGVCPRYGDMPICKEFRFFVEDDHIRCHHPYWPRFSLEEGRAVLSDDAYAELCALSDGEAEHLFDLARATGKAVGGAWSVDILWTDRGWFVTDMAEAHKSWHWPECSNA